MIYCWRTIFGGDIGLGLVVGEVLSKLFIILGLKPARLLSKRGQDKMENNDIYPLTQVVMIY